MTSHSAPSPESWAYLATLPTEMRWLTDAESRLIWQCPSLSDFIGHLSDARLTELVHPDDLAYLLDTHENAITNKIPYQIEYRLKHKNESYVWVRDRARPLFDNDAVFNGFQGSYENIHETRRTEINLNEFEEDTRFLLDWVKQLQNVTTFKEALIITRQAMQDHVGYNSAVIYLRPYPDADHVILIDAQGKLGDNLTEKYPTLQITGDKFMEDLLASNGPFVIENMREDPRTDKDIVNALDLWTTINIPIKLAGKHLGTLATGTFGDEGIRAPSPRQLRLLEQMAAHVAPVIERIRFLNELREIENELRIASDTKSDFISRMSHELRTPLNAVLGFSQVLMMDESISETNQESIQNIYEAGEHLLNLVNDTLNFSSIEKGDIELHYSDTVPKQIIEESISLSNKLANKHEVSIYFSYDTLTTDSFFTDPVRLKQIMLNLISNAIKYNKKGGSVHIESRITENKRFYVSVKDTGVGMAPEAISKIYEPFERFVPHRNTIDGFGIGLSITRSLIDLLEGETGITSVPGEGSEFWFTIPAKTAS